MVKLELGDVVSCQRYASKPDCIGTIVAFNKKGEGGKEYVHVLIAGSIEVFMHFDVITISRKSS